MGKLSASGLIYDSGSPCDGRRREHISILKERRGAGHQSKSSMEWAWKNMRAKHSFFQDSFYLSSSHSKECLFELLKKESEHTPVKEYAQWLMRGSLDIQFKTSEVAAAIALVVLGNANKLLIDNVLNHCAYMEKKCIGSPHSKPKDDACSQYRTDEE
ncbi:hypothetical protein HPP92_026373 [Vanilla planifolia]|uniref:Uncharacterized protein n=1 Tax=Vanilla planifolia TaxID=51239 RepID=A0A835U9J6_VANPL|nr:hypothetical protein HPP92_026373 [Vanilla planifolia]